MKICKTCGELKELTEFYAQSNYVDGRENRCKECRKAKSKEKYKNNNRRHRDKQIRRVYGIDHQTYDSMFTEAGNNCPLCGVEYYSTEGKGTRKVLDHCHESGKIRGVCCSKCNTAMGMANDNSEYLLRMSKWCK